MVSEREVADLRAQLAARDALVAELERLQAAHLSELADYGHTVGRLNRGIAKFRAYLDDYSDVEDGTGDNPAGVTPNWAMRCEVELDAALAGQGVSRG